MFQHNLQLHQPFRSSLGEYRAYQTHEFVLGYSTLLQKIETSGQWLVAASIYAKALKFIFPNREDEFSHTSVTSLDYLPPNMSPPMEKSLPTTRQLEQGLEAGQDSFSLTDMSSVTYGTPHSMSMGSITKAKKLLWN